MAEREPRSWGSTEAGERGSHVGRGTPRSHGKSYDVETALRGRPSQQGRTCIPRQWASRTGTPEAVGPGATDSRLPSWSRPQTPLLALGWAT